VPCDIVGFHKAALLQFGFSELMSLLDIESEVNDVTVGDNIFFSFETDLAVCFHGLFAAQPP